MDFFTKNKALIGLALAIVLTVIGLVFKVDIAATLGTVTTISKDVNALTDTALPDDTKPVQ